MFHEDTREEYANKDVRIALKIRAESKTVICTGSVLVLGYKESQNKKYM